MHRDRHTDAHDPQDFTWLPSMRFPRRQPDTELQAIMEASFGEEPVESIEETAPLREAIAAAVDALPTGERWLFEMLIHCRLSLRFVARATSIPKTTLARRRDAILADLASTLEHDPIVAERINR